MKLLIFFIGLTFISQNEFAQQAGTENELLFTLSYISIGLGSNMFEMQPMFRVKGNQFVYTSEQAWVSKDSGKPEVDTLLVGTFRTSSIDSIVHISREIKGDSVYKSNPGVMNGGIIDLSFSTEGRKLSFDLFNANDETAEKIVNILNTYVPDKYRKLWISYSKPVIDNIK